MTTAIYEPKGAAREYSPLACNLYRGCGHGCTYCYAPSCLRMDRATFAEPAPRKGILEALAKDAASLRGDPRPVLLCFTSDPYQPLEATEGLTRQAIQIMGEAGLTIRVLTKNPWLALNRDGDLLGKYRVEFGVSLVWADDDRRLEYEPMAATVTDRLAAITAARLCGLTTWVSMEPVIDPAQALRVLAGIAGAVGIIKIGKINHDAAASAAVDWPGFTAEAIKLCQERGQAYYIKDDLWAACGGTVAGPKEWPAEASK